MNAEISVRLKERSKWQYPREQIYNDNSLKDVYLIPQHLQRFRVDAYKGTTLNCANL